MAKNEPKSKYTIPTSDESSPSKICQQCGVEKPTFCFAGSRGNRFCGECQKARRYKRTNSTSVRQTKGIWLRFSFDVERAKQRKQALKREVAHTNGHSDETIGQDGENI